MLSDDFLAAFLEDRLDLLDQSFYDHDYREAVPEPHCVGADLWRASPQPKMWDCSRAKDGRTELHVVSASIILLSSYELFHKSR